MRRLICKINMFDVMTHYHIIDENNLSVHFTSCPTKQIEKFILKDFEEFQFDTVDLIGPTEYIYGLIPTIVKNIQDIKFDIYIIEE